MINLLQVIIDGAANGAIYAALALALVLIYRAAGLVNFAQGEMALLATYFVWQLTDWGVPVWPAMALAMLASFAGGMLVERVIIRRIPSDSHLTTVIVTLGLFVALNSAATYIWGTLIKSMQSPFPRGQWQLGQLRVPIDAAGTLLVIIVVMGCLFLLIQRTRFGLATRAAASNPASARLSGVQVSRVLMAGWGLAAAVGALAGALAGPRLFLEPNLMLNLLIYAFAAATLGGFDNPGGAVLGGLLVGITESVTSTYVSIVGSDLKIVVPLVLIFAVLVLRPNGLFGRKTVIRA